MIASSTTIVPSVGSPAPPRGRRRSGAIGISPYRSDGAAVSNLSIAAFRPVASSAVRRGGVAAVDLRPHQRQHRRHRRSGITDQSEAHGMRAADVGGGCREVQQLGRRRERRARACTDRRGTPGRRRGARGRTARGRRGWPPPPVRAALPSADRPGRTPAGRRAAPRRPSRRAPPPAPRPRGEPTRPRRR